MRVTRTLLLVALTSGCGGASHNETVQEVPIEQGGGGRTTSDLPPDEVGDAGGVSTVALPDGGPPPGVGPQPLDVGTSTQDAGAEGGAAAGFVHHQGGLTEKECDDLVLAFAKLTAKEKHNPTPTQADLASDAIYSQMIIDCGASTTKKQQKCGMTARSTTGWKKCME